MEKAASLKLEDIIVTPEEVEKNNVKGKDGKLPRANDLYFSVLKCCHMNMINSILKQFGIKQNEELKPETEERFLEALKHGYSIFARPTSGSGYLVKTADNPSTKAQPKEGEEQPTTKKDEETGQVIILRKGVNYFEVTPILFEEYTQEEGFIVEEFTDFDEAMRTYFENVQLVSNEHADNFQAQVWKKFENIRVDSSDQRKTRSRVSSTSRITLMTSTSRLNS